MNAPGPSGKPAQPMPKRLPKRCSAKDCWRGIDFCTKDPRNLIDIRCVFWVVVKFESTAPCSPLAIRRSWLYGCEYSRFQDSPTVDRRIAHQKETARDGPKRLEAGCCADAGAAEGYCKGGGDRTMEAGPKAFSGVSSSTSSWVAAPAFFGVVFRPGYHSAKPN